MSISIDLSGKIALVTGGTGQLGRAIVLRLAEAGADVVINYRDENPREDFYGDPTVPSEKAQELCQAIKAKGKRAIAVAADVTNRESMFQMRDTIQQQLGDPVIIVTTAMKQVRTPYLKDATESHFDVQFATSVHQHLHIMHAFVPAMRKAKYGRIVGINSVTALASNPEYSPYSTAKMAMDGVFRQMSRELASDNITANQVAPAWINSEILRQKPNPDHEKYSANTPRGKAGTDVELANVVAFLCSDLASYVSGAFIPVAGAQEFVGI
jgi:3-oxoacyl-[acyl-carrier protein] reductase